MRNVKSEINEAINKSEVGSIVEFSKVDQALDSKEDFVIVSKKDLLNWNYEVVGMLFDVSIFKQDDYVQSYNHASGGMSLIDERGEYRKFAEHVIAKNIEGVMAEMYEPDFIISFVDKMYAVWHELNEKKVVTNV